MSIKQNGGVFGRNPTFNDVTIEGDLIINGEVFTGLDFQGSWNASTNSPALASSVGTNGEFYIVSVAGTTNLNGITNWGIGDWAIFNGTVWQRVEGGADGNFNDLTANSLLVNGTATMDGLTVAGTDYGQPLLSVDNGSTGGHGAYIDTGGFTTSHYALSVNRNNGKQALRVDGLGDVSFYEDTGTTAKMVWDASEETLFVDQKIKVGNTTDGVVLQTSTGAGSILGVDTAGNGWNALDIRAGSATQLYLDTSGNVGIGTSSPVALIHGSAGDSGVTPNANYGKFFLEDNATVGLTIATPNNNSGALVFADPENSLAGRIRYDHNETAMIFDTEGAEAMRISADGSVGIGTESPAASLSLSNGTNDSNGIKMQASGWGYYARSGINGTSGGQFIQSTNWNANTNAVDSASYGTTAIIHDAPSGSVQFKTATTNTVPVESMRILSNGSVGIGTSSPARPLDVNGAIRVKSASAIEWGGVNEAIIGDTGGALIYKVGGAEIMRNTATGLGIGTSSPDTLLEIASSAPKLYVTNTSFTINDTDEYGSLDFVSEDGSFTKKSVARIQAVNSGGAGSYSALAFHTSYGTSAVNTVERMRIDKDGSVGIGTSSPSASAILDVQSTTKGVRFPNMTTTQKNAMADVAGIQVFDTTLGKMCFNTGSAWETITSS